MTLSQADQLGGSEIAQLEGMQVASEEGMRVTDHLSLLTDFTTGGTLRRFDDLHARPADLRLSQQERQSAAAALAAGIAVDHGVSLSLRQQLPHGERLLPDPQCHGEESLPQEALIINRNTFDYNFNSAMNPVLHLGNAWIAFNTGLQFTFAATPQRRST